MAGFFGWALGLACLALCVYGHMGPHAVPRHDPTAPPEPPQDASAEAEWLLLPFQLVAGLAWLCWAAILVAVFLAPLAFVAAVVWGALQ